MDTPSPQLQAVDAAITALLADVSLSYNAAMKALATIRDRCTAEMSALEDPPDT